MPRPPRPKKRPDPPHVSDAGDSTPLPLEALDALMLLPDPPLTRILAYCEQSLSLRGEDDCLDVLRRHERALLEGADPERLSEVVLRLSLAAVETLPSQFLLRLGARLERPGAYERAIRVYYRLGETKTHSFDFEAALWRLARLADKVYADPEQASEFYAEMKRLFPDGRWTHETPPDNHE